MRIVAKIATAGVAGLSRFPVANAEIDECLTPDGRLDEAKARAALNCEQVQIASTDDRRVVAFSLEYLKQMRSVVERLAENINAQGEVAASVTDEKGCRTEAATPGDRACERRMKKGRFAFCRTDITSCADGIHVKLTVQNPREVVGHTESFAYEFAVMCARILIYLKAEIATTDIVLIEGEGAQGVYDDARKLNRRDDLRKLRAQCPNRVNGYCSPCKPDCPLFCNGKCKEAKEVS